MMTIPEMTAPMMQRFLAWFESEIGTEIEVEEIALGVQVATCFELTASESRKVKTFLDRCVVEA